MKALGTVPVEQLLGVHSEILNQLHQRGVPPGPTSHNVGGPVGGVRPRWVSAAVVGRHRSELRSSLGSLFVVDYRGWDRPLDRGDRHGRRQQGD